MISVNPKVYQWCDEHNVWWVDCLECYFEELSIDRMIESARRVNVAIVQPEEEHHGI